MKNLFRSLYTCTQRLENESIPPLFSYPLVSMKTLRTLLQSHIFKRKNRFGYHHFQFFVIKYICFFSGCFVCFTLHESFNVPIVIAAAATGLLGTFIPFSRAFKSHPYASIYAGSFAGMCSSNLIGSYWELGLISLIGASLYILTMNLFAGFGGRLGSVAFASVALYMLAKGVL